jgi:hypothetical protein
MTIGKMRLPAAINSPHSTRKVSRASNWQAIFQRKKFFLWNEQGSHGFGKTSIVGDSK